MKKAVDANLKNGNIRMGAKFARTIADWYEEEYEFELAVQFFQKAADLYHADNAER